MSNVIEKLFFKCLTLIIILSVVLGFREMILTEDDISFAFGELMGMLPFAQVMTEIVCNILKCQYDLPIPTVHNTIRDLLSLAMMAYIQPIFVGALTAIFLPMPNRSYHANERYMNSFGYKIKEWLINILIVPLVALVCAYFSQWLLNYLTNIFGEIAGTIVGSIFTLVMSIFSVIPLLAAGVTFLTAILWRLLVTLGAKMVTTFVTNTICLAIYIAITGGIEYEIFMSIVSLIIWLIIMDFGMNCLQSSIVGGFRRK